MGHRNNKKKLQQIDGLKQKGGELDPDAKAKVASEARLLQEVAALERGDSEVVYEGEKKLSHADAKVDVDRMCKYKYSYISKYVQSNKKINKMYKIKLGI